MSKSERGLTDEEVKRSRELHGSNALEKEKTKGFMGKFIENLSDPIIKILLIALGVQVIFTLGHINYAEIGGIIFAILISAGVSTASEYRSAKSFERLESDSLNTEFSVMRNGKFEKVKVSDIVVGDIVFLSAGDKIPADGALISGKINVNQSSLNGESVDVTKMQGVSQGWSLDSTDKVFRGSVIIEGDAVMRVGRVGASTYYGMVAKDVQSETRQSPLKHRLNKFAAQISRIGYVIAAVVGLAYIFCAVVLDNGFDSERILLYLKDYRAVFSMLIHALTLMITVIVVAAPEGLPMMITVVLSANMKKMLSDSILVKKLVGIETAGSMNILYTDKTGTITEGRPECDRIITSGGTYRSLSVLKKCNEIFRYLNISAKYNTDVTMDGQGEITGGNATDRAVYSFFSGERAENEVIKDKIPFSSERKFSLITLKNGESIIKGGAELLLASAKYALLENGERDSASIGVLRDELKRATTKGERVIAVAICDGSDLSALTIVALIAMKDKVRRDVKKSVKNVTAAGIQIVMITGDSKDTAVAIACECGIMNPSASHIALSSDELHRLSDEELKSVLPSLRVVARALPQDKTRLVRLSQEMGLVVGMTGDGINDAPSLKLADVGFAMGSGTDIAKSASDIVILDNSFLAISKTVLYGRTIFKSIRKFITFQLIMNLAACGISLIGQFIGVDTPITIIQMLWVNIIMDTLGGLAFSGEAPLEYYMKEKPKSRDEQILSSQMLKQILMCGAFTLGMCIVFLTSPTVKMMYKSTAEHYAAFYALFIFAGIFNCFMCRCERLWFLSNISKNVRFVLIMLTISLIQIAMIYFGGEIFRCTPLSVRELWFAVSFAFAVVPFEILRRIAFKLQ